MANELTPRTCFGVKCMQKDCTELASHKVTEENLWNPDIPEEKEMYEKTSETPKLSTYLCKSHFQVLMNGTVHHFESDPRFSTD